MSTALVSTGIQFPDLTIQTTAASGGGGTITTTDFTATAGQTVFTVNYTVNLVSVYRNGVKLAAADYTATNGTSITLASPAAVGDLIEVQAFSSFSLYSTITSQDFSGTGSQTAFTMNVAPASAASILVMISGVVQDPVNYTVSSTTLTFSTAPAAGTNNIQVRYLGVASQGGGATLATSSGAGPFYLAAANVTSGTYSTAFVNTSINYNATTGDISSPQFVATNGLVVNSATVAANVTVAAGNNAMSVGPMTVALGRTVTVATGQRWVIL